MFLECYQGKGTSAFQVAIRKIEDALKDGTFDYDDKLILHIVGERREDAAGVINCLLRSWGIYRLWTVSRVFGHMDTMVTVHTDFEDYKKSLDFHPRGDEKKENGATDPSNTAPH